MNKIDIIRSAENLFPEELLNGTLTYKNSVMSLREFLENIYITAIKEYTLPDTIYNNVMDVFAPKVQKKETTIKERNNVQVIEEFINSRIDFVENIQTGPESFMNVRERLLSFADTLDENNLVAFGPKKVTLSELYQILLNNSYHEPTIVDKIELCINECTHIPEYLLESMYKLEDGTTMTLRDYIIEVLPNQMVNATDIMYNNELVSIDVVIKEIVEKQKKVIEDAKLEEFNRTGENPSLVSEINMALESELTAQEVAALTFTQGLLSEDLSSIKEDLNHIRNSIDNCASINDLNSLENDYKNYISNIQNKDSYIEAIITNIANLIENKKSNLIKIDANRDELVQRIKRRLDEITNTIPKSIEECNILMGVLVGIEQDALKVGITSTEILQKIETLKTNLGQNRVIINEEVLNKNNNYFQDTFDINISYIKNQILFLKSVQDPELYNQKAMQINYQIEELKVQITDALSRGLIERDRSDNLLGKIDNLNLENNNLYQKQSIA